MREVHLDTDFGTFDGEYFHAEGYRLATLEYACDGCGTLRRHAVLALFTRVD